MAELGYIARHKGRRKVNNNEPWTSLWRNTVCYFDWRIIRYWQSTMPRKPPCTCHPDDRPPVCPRLYAASVCKRAAEQKL